MNANPTANELFQRFISNSRRTAMVEACKAMPFGAVAYINTWKTKSSTSAWINPMKTAMKDKQQGHIPITQWLEQECE